MRSAKSACRALSMALLLASCMAGAAASADPVFTLLETEGGDILLVLDPELAPHHVDHFVYLSESGFYNGTRFHRIVPGFVIQGGDPNSKDGDPDNDGLGAPRVGDVLTEAELNADEEISVLLAANGFVVEGDIGLDAEARLKAEFSGTAKHVRGTLSMARGEAVDSAGSQFFICVADVPFLDGSYTIFGHVVHGMDTVDKIVGAEVNPDGRDMPAVPIQIIKATVIRGTDGLSDVERKAWDEWASGLKSVR